MAMSSARVGDVARRRWSRRETLFASLRDRRCGRPRRAQDGRAAAPSPRSAGRDRLASTLCRSAMRADAVAARRSCIALPTPQISETGLCARKATVSGRPITAKPRGLSRSEAILARNLLWLRPIETVMPISRSTSACEAGQRQGRAARGAAARCRSGRGRPRRSRAARPPASVPASARALAAPTSRVFCHVRRDDDGVRAGLQRLEHRHGRMDAVSARDVAGRRNHAALSAADDHRFVGKARIVALLDRGVEGVAIDVRDGEADRARDAQQSAGCRNAGNGPARPAKRPKQARQSADPFIDQIFPAAAGIRTSAVAVIIRSNMRTATVPRGYLLRFAFP